MISIPNFPAIRVVACEGMPSDRMVVDSGIGPPLVVRIISAAPDTEAEPIHASAAPPTSKSTGRGIKCVWTYTFKHDRYGRITEDAMRIETLPMNKEEAP